MQNGSFCVKSNGTAPNASNQANAISVAKQIQTAAVQTNTNWRAKQIQNVLNQNVFNYKTNKQVGFS